MSSWSQDHGKRNSQSKTWYYLIGFETLNIIIDNKECQNTQLTHKEGSFFYRSNRSYQGVYRPLTRYRPLHYRYIDSSNHPDQVRVGIPCLSITCFSSTMFQCIRLNTRWKVSDGVKKRKVKSKRIEEIRSWLPLSEIIVELTNGMVSNWKNNTMD